MTDLPIHDVPEHVLVALDIRAGRLGLSRNEYLRRRLAQEAALPEVAVSTDDLVQFSLAFADLGDPEVMSRAWR